MKWDIKAQDRESISDETEPSSFSSAEYLLVFDRIVFNTIRNARKLIINQ